MIRRAKEHVLIRIEEPEKLIRRGLKICEEAGWIVYVCGYAGRGSSWNREDKKMQ